MSQAAAIARYRVSLAEAMGVDVAIFDRPGTSVVEGEDRRGERLATHYRVGEHAVVWVDPEISVAVELDERTVTAGEFRDRAIAAGAERQGSGYDHVLPGVFAGLPRADEVTVLDPTAAEVVSLATELMDACSADDLDQADFEPGALDPYLVGWIEQGRLLALAGSRSLDVRPGFHDVGVLVHPAARRRGIGRAVVAAVVEETLAAGEHPLYRCDVLNEGSWRLCRGLGFELVAELEAFTF